MFILQQNLLFIFYFHTNFASQDENITFKN